MRWTATEAERATAELELGLRVAGVGRVLQHVAMLEPFADPSTWCAGMVERRGAVLVAGPRQLDVFCNVARSEQPQRSTWQLAEIAHLDVDPLAGGFTIDLGRGAAPLVVTAVPPSQLASFVAHLIARIPSSRRYPEIHTPGVTP